MYSKWVFFWLAMAVLVLGCISGETAKNDTVSTKNTPDDEFIKDYINEQRAEGKTTTTQQMTIANDGTPLSPTAKNDSIGQITSLSTLQNNVKKTNDPCPFDCCDDNGTFAPKSCGKWLICSNHSCIEKPCPFQCCILGMYQTKECTLPLVCVNSTCLKPPCPPDAECCSPSEYSLARDCLWGFECIKTVCQSKDTDRDGLDDVVEKNFGTNPNITDTDSDGVNDYAEVKVLHTDPRDANTDHDRYIDGADKEPLRTDTAIVKVMVAGITRTTNPKVLSDILKYLDFRQPRPNESDTIVSFDTNILVENSGTDYTSYVNSTLDIGYFCASGRDIRRKPFILRYLGNFTESNSSVANQSVWTGVRGQLDNNTGVQSWSLKSVPLNFPRLNANTRYIKFFRQQVMVAGLSDETLAALASDQRCFYNATVLDIGYERFPD